MRSFRNIQSKARIYGFQCHHLIPRQVVEMRHFASFFGEIRMGGFDPNDFGTNGMYLPSLEKLAIAFGLPLHRGSHPKYNELVAEQILRLSILPTMEAMPRIAILQSNLRAALRYSDTSNIKLIRDPMNASLERDMEAIGLIGSKQSRMPRLP